MAIGQGQLISASDFQLKTIASLTKTQSFSVAYGNTANITLGTFTIPANMHFTDCKAMCKISGGSPSTWQATVRVSFGTSPTGGSGYLNGCAWNAASGTSIPNTQYSYFLDDGLLTSSDPPQHVAKFWMHGTGDSSDTRWSLTPGTTYTVTASVSQSTSHSYSYSNVTFTFKLWLY